jgi:hypothetical protein
MQGKHIVVLAGQDFVAHLNDQFISLIVEPFAGMIRCGGSFFQDGVGRDHFTGDQVLADAEMLERALGLSTPQFVGGHFNYTEAVILFSHASHLISPV